MKHSHILSIAILVLFAFSFSATRLFYDGFEDGTLHKWNTAPNAALTGPNIPPSVISLGSHSGTHCISINWDGTKAWNAPGVQTMMSLDSFAYTSTVFTRFWVKIDPDFDTPPNGGGPKIFKWGNGNPKELYLVPRMGDNVALSEFSNASIPMVSFWGNTQSRVGGNTWHKIEQYMETGNAATIKLWVDGVLVNQWTALNTNVGGTWFPLWWASNWTGATGCCDHDASNHLYVDDFEVFSDATSGEATTGNMADASIQASSLIIKPMLGMAKSNLSSNAIVYDALGKNVHLTPAPSLAGKGNLLRNRVRLNGIYFIVANENGKQVTKKFVVMR
jgi:hypothetical protein